MACCSIRNNVVERDLQLTHKHCQTPCGLHLYLQQIACFAKVNKLIAANCVHPHRHSQSCCVRSRKHCIHVLVRERGADQQAGCSGTCLAVEHVSGRLFKAMHNAYAWNMCSTSRLNACGVPLSSWSIVHGCTECLPEA